MKTYTVTLKVRVPNKVKTNCKEIKNEVETLLGWELELGKKRGECPMTGELVTTSAVKVSPPRKAPKLEVVLTS